MRMLGQGGSSLWTSQKWNYAPIVFLVVAGMIFGLRQLTPVANVLDAPKNMVAQSGEASVPKTVAIERVVGKTFDGEAFKLTINGSSIARSKT
jgi:hypothetical protein